MAQHEPALKSDQESIQGLWRLVSYISQGRPVISGSTHYQFEGNRVKEITPSLVDGGSWATFELDPDDHPKQLTVTYEWEERDGQPASRLHRKGYELDGDTLRICVPSVWGTYPDVISDKEHSVITLVRDTGPPPATKQPSGKEPIEDTILGRLTWNDNFDNWEARVELQQDLAVDFCLEPGESSDEAAIKAGRKALEWLRENESRARLYAASQLLQTHNDSWNDDEPISAEAFTSRMTLGTVGVDGEGGIELYYSDGNLFWGHCIIVSVSADRVFTDAGIAG